MYDDPSGHFILKSLKQSSSIDKAISGTIPTVNAGEQSYTTNSSLTEVISDAQNQSNYNICEEIAKSFEAIITIYIEQPIPGEKYVVNDALNVGHTFISITYFDIDTMTIKTVYRGFYPENPLTQKQIINAENVNGRMNTEETGENTHTWNIAKSYAVSNDDAIAALEFSNQYQNKYKYNMVDNNCTTFAVKALEQAGIYDVTQEQQWTISKQTELKLQSEVDQNKIASKIIGDVSGTIGELSGYSPGQAGEDIRQSKDYIINESYG